MYSQFNNLAAEFLSRMEASFPDEEKIKEYRMNFTVLQKMNPLKPVEMFVETVRDYGEQILTKDVHFFMKDEHIESAQRFSGELGLVDRWDQMSETTKESVWEYIQGLYILGMGALGLQEELQAMINKTRFSV